MLQSSVAMPVSFPSAAALIFTALTMALTPGPNMMYLASRTLSQGRRAGLISLAGTGIGFVIYMLMANLGLAVVFVATPWLFVGLKAAGVAYLSYLAWQALRPGGHGVFEVSKPAPVSSGRLFQMGLVTNLLNPKVAIMYLTLIPQFIDPQRGHGLVQGLTLGLLQIAISLMVNGFIIITAGTIARFLTHRAHWVNWQRRVTGTLLVCVALLLAREIPTPAHV